MAKIDCSLILRALVGGISECGDVGVIKQSAEECFLALVDVLGHGSEARKIALIAEKYLNDNYTKDLIELMNGLHAHLSGTRGAVAAICRLNIATGELVYVGVGNITVRILGLKSLRLVPRDGVVGYREIHPKLQINKLFIGDVLLLHSDGIREHFEKYECAGLFSKSAADIAAGIVNKFSKMNDDASCIVLKLQGSK